MTALGFGLIALFVVGLLLALVGMAGGLVGNQRKTAMAGSLGGLIFCTSAPALSVWKDLKWRDQAIASGSTDLSYYQDRIRGDLVSLVVLLSIALTAIAVVVYAKSRQSRKAADRHQETAA
jgi:hypothetical protein